MNVFESMLGDARMRPWVASGWHGGWYGGEIFSFKALFLDSMDDVDLWLNFERSGVRHRSIEPSVWLVSGTPRLVVATWVLALVLVLVGGTGRQAMMDRLCAICMQITTAHLLYVASEAVGLLTRYNCTPVAITILYNLSLWGDGFDVGYLTSNEQVL